MNFSPEILIDKKNRIGYMIKIAILPFIVIASIFSQSMMREEFENLNNWSDLTFPKSEKDTFYSIEKTESGSFLKAMTDNSASGIIYNSTFNIFEYPKLKWRWKVSNIYKNGNALEKSGDDYPIRIYVIFKYDAEKADLLESITYESAKLIYGGYPPHSSLNYIWANRDHIKNIMPNPFTKKSQMILIEKGREKTNIWIEEEVNILEDYRRTFGMNPPPKVSLAIMSDSDGTGDSAIAWIDYIEILKKY